MRFGFLLLDSKTKLFPWFCLSLHIHFWHKPWIICLSLHIWKCWDSPYMKMLRHYLAMRVVLSTGAGRVVASSYLRMVVRSAEYFWSLMVVSLHVKGGSVWVILQGVSLPQVWSLTVPAPAGMLRILQMVLLYTVRPHHSTRCVVSFYMFRDLICVIDRLKGEWSRMRRIDGHTNQSQRRWYPCRLTKIRQKATSRQHLNGEIWTTAEPCPQSHPCPDASLLSRIPYCKPHQRKNDHNIDWPNETGEVWFSCLTTIPASRG